MTFSIEIVFFLTDNNLTCHAFSVLNLEIYKKSDAKMLKISRSAFIMFAVRLSDDSSMSLSPLNEDILM